MSMAMSFIGLAGVRIGGRFVVIWARIHSSKHAGAMAGMLGGFCEGGGPFWRWEASSGQKFRNCLRGFRSNRDEALIE